MDIIKDTKKIFIVGIKGSAMANIALILKKMGKDVTGSDTKETFITDKQLKDHKITVIPSFEKSALPSHIDLLIYSAAHGGIRNSQVEEAVNRNIPVIHQAEYLGKLLNLFEISIGVCGTHGKTTTSGMLAYCLIKLQANPSYMVGTSEFNGYNGGDYAGQKYFVIEADEYGLNPPSDTSPKLQFLHPTHCIATNIDFDHPDVYANIQETKEMYYRFLRGIVKSSSSNKVFLCADDTDLVSLSESLPRRSYETYGFDSNADLQIVNTKITTDATVFEAVYKSQNIGLFSLSLFGGKHALNAGGVILALLNLGFSPDAIRKVIEGYMGAKRRFELVKKIKTSYLFDDYAHHPEEIRSTLETAKKRFAGRRILVVFQPHTYSRTISMKDQFIDALSSADLVYLSPIFASAREQSNSKQISSNDLVETAKKRSFNNFYSYSVKSDLLSNLHEQFKPGDIIFTMGAGDIYKLKDDIIDVMKSGI